MIAKVLFMSNGFECHIGPTSSGVLPQEDKPPKCLALKFSEA